MSNQPPNNEPWQSPPPYQNGGLPPSPQWQQPPYQQSQQPPNTYYPEQPYQQPPNTYYPQQPYQQPYQPMPPQPPKKKSRLWLWIVLAVVAVLLFGCIGVFALIGNAAKN
ncbi:MAG: hypothetical protein E6J11_18455, partial [Chloroflexi bacterium]